MLKPFLGNNLNLGVIFYLNISGMFASMPIIICDKVS